MTHARAVTKLKDDIHSKAKKNIDNAQEKDKIYYDRKHADKRVSRLYHCMSVPWLFSLLV